MAKRNFFAPKQEIFDNLSYKDQKRIGALITCDLIFSILFVLFTVVLFLSKHFLSGGLVIPISFLFITSLFLVKNGKIHIGSLISTIGTTLACFIIAFFTENLNTPIVHYRTACFCITMAILNGMAAVKNYQLIILHVSSIVFLITSQFTVFWKFFVNDPKEWISALIINIIAMLASNLVLYANSKNNDTIVAHSENEHNQIADDMNTITTVLNETKESLNIGNKLNDTSSKATESVDKINELYRDVLKAADVLIEQTQNAKNASSGIASESEKIGERIMEQTNSISTTSTAITQISSNLSNINAIAEKRRERMGDVAQTLDSESSLLERLVSQVEKVKESSAEIAKFVQTVDSIAGQTNLLAMNASIEAAHAGTMGKGFGVIAQEIRKLSEQTAKNAALISDTLKENTEFVQQTADSVTAFATENQNSAQEIKETINGIEEILRGIGEMNLATHDVMVSLQTIVEKANNNSDNLKTVVSNINNQNDNLLVISDSTETLQRCMASLSDMITAINVVIFEMRESAKQNDEVSARINALLK